MVGIFTLWLLNLPNPFSTCMLASSFGPQSADTHLSIMVGTEHLTNDNCGPWVSVGESGTFGVECGHRNVQYLIHAEEVNGEFQRLAFFNFHGKL